MATLLKTPAAWPRILLARADAKDPTDLDAAVGGRGIRRASGDRSAISAGPRRSRRSRRPACAAVAVPASRPGRSGARAASTEADRRYVVANGYGADPASHTDRTLLAARPVRGHRGHRDRGLRDRRDRGVHRGPRGGQRGRRAAQRRDRLRHRCAASSGRMSSAPACDLWMTVRPVQGAYMLGEETVLLKALEGKRGQPEQRPPHPASVGPVRPPDGRQQRPDARVGAVDRARRRRRVPRDRLGRCPGHGPGPGADAGSDGIAEVAAGHAARRHRQARRQARGRSARCRRCSSAGRRVACSHRMRSTPPTSSPRCGRLAPTSGPGRSSPSMTGRILLELVGVLTRFCSNEACGKSIPCRIGTERLAEIVVAIASRPPATRPTRSSPPTSRTTSSSLRCATTSAWRRSRSRAGCDTSAPPFDPARRLTPSRPRPPDDRHPGSTGSPAVRRRNDGPRRRHRPSPLAERLLDTQSPQRPQSTPRIRIEVDGRVVEGFEGQTILEVCRDNGIEIPTLCYEPKLPGFGACRMCVVEVEGEEHPPISCSRTCEADMKVQTQTEEIRRLRRTNLELIFSRPQRLLPAAVPEQVPEPHRHPGLPQGRTPRPTGARARGSSSARSRSRRVLGRVCPAPCEEHCRRDEVDEAIAIRDSHRYAGDQVIKSDARRRRRSTAAVRAAGAVRAGGPRSSAPGRPAWPPRTTCSSPATT